MENWTAQNTFSYSYFQNLYTRNNPHLFAIETEKENGELNPQKNPIPKSNRKYVSNAEFNRNFRTKACFHAYTSPSSGSFSPSSPLPQQSTLDARPAFRNLRDLFTQPERATSYTKKEAATPLPSSTGYDLNSNPNSNHSKGSTSSLSPQPWYIVWSFVG